VIALGEFAEGTTSTLECNSKINSNLINYTWYKGNERVNLDELNANLTENKINFYNLSHLAVDDSYWCELQVLKTSQTIRSDPLLLQVKRNFFFSQLKSSASLLKIQLNSTLKDNPLISILPNQSIIRLNHSDSLNITCSVDSFPIQYGFWKHLNEEHLNAFPYQEKSITYESYLVSSLKRSDNGSYACCLLNEPTVCDSVDVIVQSILLLTIFTK
jgi:hypothetical protein